MAAPTPQLPRTLLLLGSGELGKEVAIAAQRMGVRVIAADRYAGAPAMQVAHASEVFPMLDGDALEEVVRRHAPDFIVPEVEAIRTEKLRELEAEGFNVVPTAEATWMTMDRQAIRELAAGELGLRTAGFAFADDPDGLLAACDAIGYPCVVKPVMSSSGKGQTVVTGSTKVEAAWNAALEGRRGDQSRVIVEEFIPFHTEITLLTIRERDGTTRFVEPIGHRQEQGDYRESWMPAGLDPEVVRTAEKMARAVTARLGGAGVFGVEFFITDDDVVFSELSPRPHDTGMVTMISQDLSQFDLHVRAILGIPIPVLSYAGPSASAVILADREGPVRGYDGVDRALEVETAQLRIFGKPRAWPFRRMGITLARGGTVAEARARALESASRVEVLVGSDP
ncbi:MAG: formate-dependent phosphoribosylglycinamide formyltransferase [Gemmatimonadales bacterium]|nr:MAG: formate-dependent phosphoribosylglycinamide formyltransferase [Gemmatimonadales bacterium]